MSSDVVQFVRELDKQGSQPENNSDVVTISNGISFKTKAVPYKFIIKLNKRYKNPPAPKVYLEDKGREIVNYSDPQWEADCAELQEEKGMAMLELLVGLGTEINNIPANMYSPADQGWVDEIAPFLDEGEIIPDAGKARYVAWVLYYALINPLDMTKVASKIQAKMGVTEEGAAEAMARFQRNEGRTADPEPVPEAKG